MAHQRQPFRLRLALQGRAILGRELRSDRLEVIAGIEAFRNRTDILAQRLAIAQEGRACERIDLRTGVIDVVLACNREPGEGKKVGERVAEHSAAAMTHMHRSGRVGGHVFNIDGAAAAHVAAPIICARSEDCAQCADPSLGLERQIDEARPCDFCLRHQIVAAQLCRDRFRQYARLRPGVFGQHHGRIGRHVAVGALARRLDHDAGLVNPERQCAILD